MNLANELQNLLGHAGMSASALESLIQRHPQLRQSLINHLMGGTVSQTSMAQLLKSMAHQQQQSPLSTGSFTREAPGTPSTAKENIADISNSSSAQQSTKPLQQPMSRPASPASMLDKLQKKLAEVNRQHQQQSQQQAVPQHTQLSEQSHMIPEDRQQPAHGSTSHAKGQKNEAEEKLEVPETAADKSLKIDVVAEISQSIRNSESVPSKKKPDIVKPVIKADVISLEQGEVIHSEQQSPEKHEEEAARPFVPIEESTVIPVVVEVDTPPPTAIRPLASEKLFSSKLISASNNAETSKLVLHSDSNLMAEMRQELKGLLASLSSDKDSITGVHIKIEHHDLAIQEIQKSMDELVKKISSLYVLLSKNQSSLAEHQQSKQSLLTESRSITSSMVDKQKKITDLLSGLSKYQCQSLHIMDDDDYGELSGPHGQSQTMQKPHKRKANKQHVHLASTVDNLPLPPPPHPPGYPYGNRNVRNWRSGPDRQQRTENQQRLPQYQQQIKSPAPQSQPQQHQPPSQQQPPIQNAPQPAVLPQPVYIMPTAGGSQFFYTGPPPDANIIQQIQQQQQQQQQHQQPNGVQVANMPTMMIPQQVYATTAPHQQQHQMLQQQPGGAWFAAPAPTMSNPSNTMWTTAPPGLMYITHQTTTTPAHNQPNQ